MKFEAIIEQVTLSSLALVYINMMSFGAFPKSQIQKQGLRVRGDSEAMRTGIRFLRIAMD